MDGLYWTDLHKQVPPLRLLPQIELQRIAKRLWIVFGGARILWDFESAVQLEIQAFLGADVRQGALFR